MNPNEPNSFNQPLAPSGDGQSEGTMPLGVGGFEADTGADILGGSAPGRKINTGTLLLVGVVIAAVAGLIIMKKLAQANAEQIGNKTLDAFIADFLDPKNAGQLDNPLDDKNQELIAVLNETYADRQVPLSNVARNPFVVFEETRIISQPIEVDNTDDVRLRRWKREREERRVELAQSAESFQLKSVMMGSNPLANISGKIVRMGQTILSSRGDIPFTVKSIGAGEAVLVTTVEEYDLEVEIVLVLDRN